MRFLWVLWLSTGCAYISDKHEDWRLDPDEDGKITVKDLHLLVSEICWIITGFPCNLGKAELDRAGL